MLRDTISGSKGSSLFRQDPVTGVLLFYDNSRSMYISADRETFKFGIDHRTLYNSMWMKITGGVNSLTNGYLISRNAIITCLSISTQNSDTNCIFRVKSNVSNPDITSIPLVGSSSNTIDNLSININSGDYLRVYADIISDKIEFPEMLIEIAWR